MSLILEALNKAEQNNSAPSSSTAPPAYPLEKKRINKSLLLILIATACITSAIVTLLAIYTMESDSGASHRQAQAAQEPASAAIKELAEPQPAHQTASRKAMATQATIDETPDSAGFSTRSAPGFGHLISQRNRRDRTTTVTQEPSTIKTTAPADAIATARLDAQGDRERAKAQDHSEIKNLQPADMKISVHMYSKTPAKRFVYINSTRYSENSLISDGIFLDEITENGIILNVNGTRYRMPIKL